VIQPANEVVVLAVAAVRRADAGICQDMIVCQKLPSDEADIPKYASLHKLSSSINKLIVITRDFLSTESVAQFPTAYTSLQDDILVPSYEADIMRFMNRCQDLRRVLGLMEYTFK